MLKFVRHSFSHLFCPEVVAAGDNFKLSPQNKLDNLVSLVSFLPSLPLGDDWEPLRKWPRTNVCDLLVFLFVCVCLFYKYLLSVPRVLHPCKNTYVAHVWRDLVASWHWKFSAFPLLPLLLYIDQILWYRFLHENFHVTRISSFQSPRTYISPRHWSERIIYALETLERQKSGRRHNVCKQKRDAELLPKGTSVPLLTAAIPFGRHWMFTPGL